MHLERACWEQGLRSGSNKSGKQKAGANFVMVVQRVNPQYYGILPW